MTHYPCIPGSSIKSLSHSTPSLGWGRPRRRYRSGGGLRTQHHRSGEKLPDRSLRTLGVSAPAHVASIPCLQPFPLPPVASASSAGPFNSSRMLTKSSPSLGATSAFERPITSDMETVIESAPDLGRRCPHGERGLKYGAGKWPPYDQILLVTERQAYPHTRPSRVHQGRDRMSRDRSSVAHII